MHPRDAKAERSNLLSFKKNSVVDKNKKKPKLADNNYRKVGPHSIFLYKPGTLLPDLSSYLNGMIEVLD